MTTRIFGSSNDDGKATAMIVSQSGEGKSFLLQAEAQRLGITYDEMLRRVAPPEDQKDQLIRLQDEADLADMNRLQAVREAYWHNTPEGHRDLNQLHDLLVESGVVGEPTREQIRRVFMLLPAEIIGAALSWGLGDTEERESVYEFLVSNKQLVLEAINPESA